MENAGVAQVAGDLEKHEFHPWLKICSLCINCSFVGRPVSFIYGSRWLILFTSRNLKLPLFVQRVASNPYFDFGVLFTTQKGRTVFYWNVSRQTIKFTPVLLNLCEYEDLFLTSGKFRGPSQPILMVVLPSCVNWKNTQWQNTVTISGPLSMNSVSSPSIAWNNCVNFLVFRVVWGLTLINNDNIRGLEL